MKRRLFLILICLTLTLSYICLLGCNNDKTNVNVVTQRAVEEQKDEKPLNAKRDDEFFKHRLHNKRPPKHCPERPNFNKESDETKN